MRLLKLKNWKSSSFLLFKRSVQRSDVVEIISETHLVTCKHFFMYDKITAVTDQSYMIFKILVILLKKRTKALRKLRHWLKLEQGFAQKTQKSCFGMINFSYEAHFFAMIWRNVLPTIIGLQNKLKKRYFFAFNIHYCAPIEVDNLEIFKFSSV